MCNLLSHPIPDLQEAMTSPRGGIVLEHVESETAGAGPWSSQRVLRFTRTASATDKDFRRDVTVAATIWAVSASGDLVSKDITYIFALVEKAKNSLDGQDVDIWRSFPL